MLTNPITGEVYDLSTDQGFKQAYDDIKMMKKQVTDLDKKFKQISLDKLGDNLEMKVGLYDLVRITTPRRAYPVSALKKYFDEDTLMLVMKPVNKLVEEQAQRLSNNDRMDLYNEAEIVGKSISIKLK